MAGSLCDWKCPGYNEEPMPGSLWPGESEADFGYPVGPYGWKEVDANPRARGKKRRDGVNQ